MGGFLSSNGRNNYSSFQCSTEERKAVTATKVDKNPFHNNSNTNGFDRDPEARIKYFERVLSELPLWNRKDRKFYSDQIELCQSLLRHPSNRWAS